MTAPTFRAILRTGEDLREQLARRNIPAHLYPTGQQVAIWLWAGLIARTDGLLIWWPTLRTDSRGQPLYSYATTAAGAAEHLARHYEQYRQAYPIETLTRLHHLVPQ